MDTGTAAIVATLVGVASGVVAFLLGPTVFVAFLAGTVVSGVSVGLVATAF